MKPVLTAVQMRECDRIAIEEHSIPSLDLMERAATGVANKVMELLNSNSPSEQVWVFCGTGNNGGDGFAAARLLADQNISVKTFIVGNRERLTPDAKHNYQLWQDLGNEVFVIDDENFLSNLKEKPSLVIDALLGTGFKGELTGIFAAVVNFINECPKVVAVDIPSGINADDGNIKTLSVRATTTVTFGCLKRGLTLHPGKEMSGEIKVIDIGIPATAIERQNVSVYLPEQKDLQLPSLKPTAHKGNTGHVLIIAGSPGYTGAAALASTAAMRSGSGLVICAVPRSLNAVLEVKLTEAMTLPLPETDTGELSAEGLNLIINKLDWAHSICIGPGLGQNPSTMKLLLGLLDAVKNRTRHIDKPPLPIIIDADALNMLAKQPEYLHNLPPNVILTPHPGEFNRLSRGKSIDYYGDRINAALAAAEIWNAVVVLKGAPTITALPNKTCYVNPTGNAGMATGGSGDVLSGIIAARAARQVCQHRASSNEQFSSDFVWQSVYLHGLAGDLACAEKSMDGMIASDIIEKLPSTIMACL